MTPEGEALAAVVAELEALGIPYMVTGSVASSHHGRPRTTHDTDIVIDPSRESLSRLVENLTGRGFYVDLGRAQDALLRRTMFNVIEMQSASKVDLILLKNRPFSLEEFGRRRAAEIADGIRVHYEALGVWDDENRAAFLAWAEEPFWP